MLGNEYIHLFVGQYIFHYFWKK